MAFDMYVSGTPKNRLASKLSEKYGISENMAWTDVVELFEHALPEACGATEISGRLQIAILRAEAAHRVAWEELRALQAGTYDYETTAGTRRPVSPPYLAMIIHTQRHLAELTRACSADQIWQEKRELERIKAGALQQILGELDTMSDEQLRLEASRLIAEPVPDE